jgi:hypothetical protein
MNETLCPTADSGLSQPLRQAIPARQVIAIPLIESARMDEIVSFCHSATKIGNFIHAREVDASMFVKRRRR